MSPRRFGLTTTVVNTAVTGARPGQGNRPAYASRMVNGAAMHGGVAKPWLRRALPIVWLCVAMLAAVALWSALATRDDATSGQDKVMPSSPMQMIQSPEGSSIAARDVRHDDVRAPLDDPLLSEAKITPREIIFTQ